MQNILKNMSTLIYKVILIFVFWQRDVLCKYCSQHRLWIFPWSRFCHGVFLLHQNLSELCHYYSSKADEKNNYSSQSPKSISPRCYIIIKSTVNHRLGKDTNLKVQVLMRSDRNHWKISQNKAFSRSWRS